MTDGIIKQTGNSRFLKSAITSSETWEEFRAKLIAGTAPIDLNGINEEGWQQIGDALGKSSLLPDVVCTSLGIPTTSVPADAFMKVSPGDIGSIVSTSYAGFELRDGRYLSCDGSAILEEDYPDLYPLLSDVNIKCVQDSGVTTYLYGVAYGDGLYVVVGASGVILTSPDAITWTARTSGVTTTLEGVTYVNGLYVAVGAYGVIRTSPDAITWTARTSGVTSNIQSVACGNGLYVAVGDSGVILTSTNGITWTARTSGVTTALYSVVYGNGLYVAVSASGTILTSPDAITWTAITSGVTTWLYGVVYGDGLFVAVGRSGVIITSHRTLPNLGDNLMEHCYIKALEVAE